MEHSDTDYTGWKNGRCLTIATKFTGKGSAKENALTVSDMARDGFEIREMPRSEAVAAHCAAFA